MPPAPTLDDLRRQIDEIDDALHDLLMRRTEVVARIAGLKKSARKDPAARLSPFRPGREAAILRRVVARHQGKFPVPALYRIWREMISALTQLQARYSVAVQVGVEHKGCWDLARDHFGSCTPLVAAPTALAVLRAVAEGTAAVGVLPWPEDDDPDPWWRYLFSEDAKTPRVMAVLPFVPHARNGSVPREGEDAVAIGVAPLEPTGHDRTVLGVELAASEMSRGRVRESLDAVGLPPLTFRTHHLAGGGSVYLVEVEGAVEAGDPRLASLEGRFGEALVRIIPVGLYATPLTAGEPALALAHANRPA